MTPEEADEYPQWTKLDGAIVWHLIDRHADSWGGVGKMMNAWLRANVLAEREACAGVCENFEDDMGYGKEQKCADAIRMRSNASLSGRPR